MTTAAVCEIPADTIDRPVPVLDIVIPVYNEEHVLESSVVRLRRHLSEVMPFSWRITIADNASTDGTWLVAQTLAALYDDVRLVHLDRKGRGLALRSAWLGSDASVLVYMDVDLSTGLDALLPLVAPLVTGHSDVAIGSRLAAGSQVARGPKREFISRTYNAILRTVFAVRFSDAQCGFKAIRADVARSLVPAVADNAWFFDTELLLLAEHNGLRVHEVPVDWIDDPDSRVHVASTAKDDLRGVARMARRFMSGHGDVELPARVVPAIVDDMGRQMVSFATVGTVSTAVSLTLFLFARPAMGALWANGLALGLTAVGNAWAHRHYTFGRGRDRRHHYARSAAVFTAGLTVSSAALVVVRSSGGGSTAEVLAVLAAWWATAIVRFSTLRDQRRNAHGGLGKRHHLVGT
ncbi:MAG: glycosyltransferase [Acidimicrobiia bacterium]